jgi:ClpP class serine protease
MSYQSIVNRMEPMRNDPAIQTVFMQFDGNGGEASGCFDTVEYIRNFPKKVVGLINGGSFSANYALASACDSLYITPYSRAGSIGVISGRMEVNSDNSPVKYTYFTSGEAKTDGQPHKPMDDAESKRNQAAVDDIAGQFFALVAANRSVSVESVQVIDAKMLNAQAMLDAGLVDAIKTEEDFFLMHTNKSHDNAMATAKTEFESAQAALQSNYDATIAGFQAQNDQLSGDAQGAENALAEQKKGVELLAKLALSGAGGLAGSQGLAQAILAGIGGEGAAAMIKKAAAEHDANLNFSGGKLADDEFNFTMDNALDEVFA